MDIDPARAQQMFQAIVAQAFLDAVLPDNERYSKRPVCRRKAKPESDEEWAARNAKVLAFRKVSANQTRTDARAWLLGNGEDFRMIVTLAGYNPDDIHEQAVRLESEGWPQKIKAREHYLMAA